MDQQQAILDELSRAAERLGGDGERIRALPQAEIYEALEDLGADRFLLAFVGSWGDTLSDADVLEGLKGWNRGATPLDRVIASTGGKRE